MNIRKMFLNNLGLKVTAMFLAILVWVMISGKERAYSEKSFIVNVEYINVGQHIDVRSVRPDKVRFTVRGTSKELENIAPEDFKILIDLKDVTEGTHLKFTENYLQSPEGIEILAIHNRTVEITVREFMTREVPVRVRYKGRLPKGIRLLDRRPVPEKVKIFGYKSQVAGITTVEGTEFINLDEINENKSIRLPLKKVPEILRFADTDTVDVLVTVENLNKKKDEEDGTK